MHVTADQIVAIPAARERYFGCAGTLLLPCPATVAALLGEIPRGQVATLEQFRRELGRRHGVAAVCPFHTKQALLALAREPADIAYWRLVKKNGELLGYLPGGVSNHAARLVAEGLAIKPTGRPRLDRLEACRVRF